MSNLQENVVKLDQLCHLLTKTEISGSKKESKQVLEKFVLRANERVHELQQDISEIQIEWDILNEKEINLTKKYKETIQTRSIQQQQQKNDEDICKKERIRNEKLKRELDLLEEELIKETEDATCFIGDDQEQLALALFRGMGIEMHVEDNMSIKKAILTSPNEQDFVTIPISSPNMLTTKKIWDFISTDL